MSSSTDTSVPPISPPQRFTVTFAEDEILELQRRLATARLPDEPLLPSVVDARDQFQQIKPDLPWFKNAIKAWQQLNLKTLQEKFNAFDHYTTSIDWCKQLHFVHKRSSRADAIPIILIHGWPGTWYEFSHVIDRLAEPNDASVPAFHVVAPSLPGFTFSSPPPSNEKGVGDVYGYSRILNALMRGLGYEQYASQGGDWGSPHARALGALYANKDGTGCRAVHLNFCPVSPSGFTKKLRDHLPLSVIIALARWVYDEEHVELIAKSSLFEQNMAYYTIQRLRPAQLAYGLIDSPIGLLGWLGYFYDAVIANREHPTLNLEALVESASLFYFTKSIGTSFLPYTNNRYLPDLHASPDLRLSVPLGYSKFPLEIVCTPKVYVDSTTTNNSTRWIADATAGGHFAALEEPDVFVGHLQSAFAQTGKLSNQSDNGIKNSDIQGGLWDEVRKQTRGKL